MKYFFTLFVIVIVSQVTLGQNSIRPNIYLQDMQYYNPASVPLDSNYRLQTAVYAKYKSVDNEEAIWNKPMNIWLSHVNRIGQSNSFFTLSYVSDGYSFFNRNALYLGYLRQVKLGKSSSISYGGRVVGNIDKVNWNKFELPHNQNNKSLYFNPDIDLGITYQFKRFSAGIGLKNLFENSTKVEGATLLKNRKEINTNLSYRQPFGKQFSITPFVLLAHERSTLIDAGLSFSFFNTINASYALRVNELKSVIVLDAKVTKNWSLGIAYDRSSLVADNNFDFVIRYRR